jgi:hypothetical protein
MRIIATIPHPSIGISIFSMNDKFIVKFEAGPMEQVFKFTTEQARTVEEVKQLVSPDFITQVQERFNAMYLQWKDTVASH